jgi:aryl-alcohol dehydrogenase-like predicted oxidoreductase
MNTQKKTLGRTGIEVSRVGLGCVTFGREVDEATSFQIMDYALDNGITLFDTAEIYGGGEARDYRRNVFGIEDTREVSGEFHSSEKIIGRWLSKRRCRDKIILQTKVTTNFTVSHLTEALDASLQRLQTDTIDFYLFHTFDPHSRLEEGLLAMTLAVKAGKIRVAGCSNFSADQLRYAVAISHQYGFARMEVFQPVYNLVAREIEKDILPLCHTHEISVVTYSPLAAGFLSGKYTPDRGAFLPGSRFDVIPGHADDYFSDRNFRLVERLRTKAETNRIPMVRLALGWVLRNSDVTSVLVGARTTSQLQNALTAQEMDFPDQWLSEMNAWD